MWDGTVAALSGKKCSLFVSTDRNAKGISNCNDARCSVGARYVAFIILPYATKTVVREVELRIGASNLVRAE